MTENPGRRAHALQIALALIIGGSIAGFATSFSGTQWYTAEATLAVVPGTDAATDTSEVFYEAWNRTLSPDFLGPLISRTLSYRLVMVSPEEIVQQIRENGKITDTPGKGAVTIRYSGDDQETTLDIVQMLVAGLDENAAVIRHVQSTAKATRIASPPRVYSSGWQRALYTLAGAGIGSVLACLAALAIGMTRGRTAA